MKRTAKNISLTIVLLTLISFSVWAQDSITIATFADPATDSTTPLFTLDFNAGANGVISGNWLAPGLDLIVLNTATYPDATFRMTDVNLTSISDPFRGIKTEGGTINFLASDSSPLLQIAFDSGWINLYGLGSADEDVMLAADAVTITGPALGGKVLQQESFAFSFTNHVPLQGNFANGFTATASFTSSAVPEPCTMILMSLGGLGLLRRKRNK